MATPHKAAGPRRDPVASEPWATGTIPHATAAAGPPLDPPTDRERSHGLRVGSNPGGLGRDTVRKWWTGSLPDEVVPCSLQLLGQSCGPPRRHAGIAQRCDTYPVRRSGQLLSRVLQEDRHSRAGSFEEGDDYGIDDRVEPFDGLRNRSTELSDAECSALQLAGLLHGAQPADFLHQLSLPQARFRTNQDGCGSDVVAVRRIAWFRPGGASRRDDRSSSSAILPNPFPESPIRWRSHGVRESDAVDGRTATSFSEHRHGSSPTLQLASGITSQDASAEHAVWDVCTVHLPLTPDHHGTRRGSECRVRGPRITSRSWPSPRASPPRCSIRRWTPARRHRDGPVRSRRCRRRREV